MDYGNTPSQPNPGPGYLWSWSGNLIAAYTAGQSVAGGDFDVADIALVSPTDGASVTLPANFCWTPRGIAGDNYRLVIWDVDEDKVALTDYLGEVPCATLTGLPSSWPSGREYRWYVVVNRGADPNAAPYNFGISYGDRLVTINSSTAAGREDVGGPQQLVPLVGDRAPAK